MVENAKMIVDNAPPFRWQWQCVNLNTRMTSSLKVPRFAQAHFFR